MYKYSCECYTASLGNYYCVVGDCRRHKAPASNSRTSRHIVFFSTYAINSRNRVRKNLFRFAVRIPKEHIACTLISHSESIQFEAWPSRLELEGSVTVQWLHGWGRVLITQLRDRSPNMHTREYIKILSGA